MNPYAALERIGLYIGLMAALFCSGLYKGYHMEKTRWQAASDKQKAEAFEQYKADAEKINDLSIKLAQAEAKTKTVYLTNTNTTERVIHEKPILSTTLCLDNDSMRLFNANLHGKTADIARPTEAVRPAAGP